MQLEIFFVLSSLWINFFGFFLIIIMIFLVNVLKVLGLLLSMLELANKDKKLEAVISGTRFLSRKKEGAWHVE